MEQFRVDYYDESRRVIDALTDLLGPGHESQILFESLTGKRPASDPVWQDFYVAAKQELNELRRAK